MKKIIEIKNSRNLYTEDKNEKSKKADLRKKIFRKKFNQEERSAGIVNFILGSTHITEGAIPFAAEDPIKVLPILMLGSSISAILSYMFKVQVPAPHGGFLILPVVTNGFLWVVAILIGSLIGAVLYGQVKKVKD